MEGLGWPFVRGAPHPFGSCLLWVLDRFERVLIEPCVPDGGIGNRGKGVAGDPDVGTGAAARA